MNNKIITIAIAILFLVSAITVLFSSGRALGETFKTYILKVEQCEYRPIPFDEQKEIQEVNQKCQIDYNNAKRILAESLALFIISTPLTVFSYKRLMSLKEI